MADSGDDSQVTLVFSEPGLRRCAECSLCCKLVPMQARPFGETLVTVGAMIEHGMAARKDFDGMVPDFAKPAGVRCEHQRAGKGCAIYAKRPSMCRVWSCRWLVNDDTADLRRPDRSRYVIDITMDFVTARPNDGGEPYNIPVVQIWCDSKAPDAWRDPALLAYLDRRGKDGVAALIRFDNKRGITVFPPSMTGADFKVIDNAELRKEHTFMEKVAAISTAPKIVAPT